MPQFMTYYSVGEWGKVWFEADSKEQAEDLLQQVIDGELDIAELPAYDSSIKGGDPFEFEGLTEVK